MAFRENEPTERKILHVRPEEQATEKLRVFVLLQMLQPKVICRKD